MSVEYNFEDPDDYFLVEVDRLVEDCLYDKSARKANIEILKINRNSLRQITRRGRVMFAENLISKIDYLLKLEEGK